MNFRKIVLLIVTLTLFACGGEENPIDPSEKNSIAENLIPLSLNNSWSYNYYRSYNNQIIFKDSIESDTMINGNNWYIIESHRNGSSEYKAYCLNKEDGFYSFIIDSNGIGREHLLYKYPAEEGDAYNTDVNTKVKVLNTNRTVNYRGESKTTILYEIFTEQVFFDKIYKYRIEEFVEPGVGIIRTNYYLFNEESQEYEFDYKVELFDYKLN